MRTPQASGRDVEVVGPVTGARPPSGAPHVDLSARGYVVEEFQIAGTAAAYVAAGDTPPGSDGRWELEEAGIGDYVSRVLVIRPSDSARFNGTVLLNWQNVSGGAEIRAPSGGELYDGGFAWVGVSAQEVGIYGFPMGMDRRLGTRSAPLKDHDPERYAPLFHPGDQGSFTIFHDAAAWSATIAATAVDPMGGLPVERVVAVGGSQSAMRLVAYFNGLHAIEPVVDGFVLGVWEGKAPRYEEGSMPFGAMTRVRDDTPTPMIVVNSEFEAPPVANVGAVDTETFRIWEVCRNAARAVAHQHRRRRLDVQSARARASARGRTAAPCTVGSPKGPRRATSRAISVETGPTGTHPARRVSGTRSAASDYPELAAPLREYRGIAFGTGRPPLMGSSRAFAPEVVHRLYASQDAYTAQWCAAVDDLVSSGVVRAEDAAAMKARVPLLPSA